MPELQQELELLSTTHRQMVAAQRVGPAVPPTGPADPLPMVPGYRLESELAEGGQGSVYRATQISTGRRVAVKLLAGGSLQTRRRQARLEREVAILATLDHPNIVGVFDHGRANDGTFFLAMDYIDGPELDAWLLQQRSAARSVEQYQRMVLETFVKIADAAGEAHQRGIVHRDLKPPNIRVDARGEPHLLDFGLARQHLESSSSTILAAPNQRAVSIDGQVVGSLPWMSPEQAAGTGVEITAASDVYSIGLMLYEGLSGEPAYSTDGTLVEVLSRVQQAIPAPIARSIRLPHPESVAGIVERTLSKSPSNRYVNGTELAADLRRYLAGEKVRRTAPTRRAWARVLIGVGVILLGVSIGMIASMAGKAQRPETTTSAAGATTSRAGEEAGGRPVESFSAMAIPDGGERVVLRPEDDAYVRNGEFADIAFGAETPGIEDFRVLEVKQSERGYSRDAYLRFDLLSLPRSGRIHRAWVRIYGSADAGSRVDEEVVRAVRLGVFRLQEPDQAWDELTLTWNSRPFIADYNQIERAVGVVTMPLDELGWHEVEVTEIVRETIGAGRTDLTIALHFVAKFDVRATFHSSEGANSPELHVVHFP